MVNGPPHVASPLMADTVKLVGLDFGTTTSSAVVASARLSRTAIGRMELDEPEETFRSEMVFTPLADDGRLDVVQAERLLDGWLEAGRVKPGELFGGGALLTGLTARADNASALVDLIRRRLGDALIATADDPCLESWLAFMGSCAALSGQYPDKAILNFDIGGGTTNLALGRDRQALRTGCWFLGARHVQVLPGTYRIVRMSDYGRAIFDHLGLTKNIGDELSRSDLDAILTFSVGLLEAVVTGSNAPAPIAKRLEQAPFHLPRDMGDVIVTFSGGVGELIYRHLRGEPWPPTTHFGDLGIDLARRIAASPVWAESLGRYRPQSAGRATVYGLLRHATEISGTTLFLGAPDILPLADVPILGRLAADSTVERIRELLALVRRSGRGGCLQVRIGSQESSAVRGLGQRLATALEQDAFPPAHPLILLVAENVGKVLGQYATRWGALPVQLLVIDELPARDAQYVRIGAARNQVVPVSCYGFLPQGDDP
jgi:ethanolamine utilization protein EutA